MILPCPVVLQESQLRPEAAFQNDVRAAIAIEIDHRERAAIVRKIESAYARNVDVFSGLWGEQHVGLAAVPAIVFADKLVDRIPAVFVRGGRLRFSGRTRYHLPPEKTV